MAKNAYDFKFHSINSGKEIKLSDFKEKIVMVVNTASECGFTNQYGELENLYNDYKDKGLVIIAVPSIKISRCSLFPSLITNPPLIKIFSLIISFLSFSILPKWLP